MKKKCLDQWNDTETDEVSPRGVLQILDREHLTEEGVKVFSLNMFVSLERWSVTDTCYLKCMTVFEIITQVPSQ